MLLSRDGEIPESIKEQCRILLKESKELPVPDDGFLGHIREQRIEEEKRRKERMVRMFKSVYGEDCEIDMDLL